MQYGCHHTEVPHDDVHLQSSISTQCLYHSALTQIPNRHWEVSVGVWGWGYFLRHTCLLRLLLNVMALPGTPWTSRWRSFSWQNARLRELFSAIFPEPPVHKKCVWFEKPKGIHAMALIIIHFVSAAVGGWHSLAYKTITRLLKRWENTLKCSSWSH